jgi:urease beta subunit
MRPGEIIPGKGPAPVTAASRRGTIRVRNTGRFPAYIGSHFPLTQASSALELERAGLEGARLALPAGASARIEPGEHVELEIVWT